MINAKVIADSINEFGNRITTMIVTMPRYILAEFNTHRMFSRNSASSRAIPFAKMVESIKTNPYIPIAWMKDHKGMQGTEYFTEKDTLVDGGTINTIECLRVNHLNARDEAISRATIANKLGLTKQVVNRYLEPFMWHTDIITASEWENFFALRCPQYEVPFTWEKETFKYRSKKDVINKLRNKQKEDSTIGTHFKEDNDSVWRRLNKGQADIHMMATAEAMWDAYNESTPKELKAGMWHIPFSDKIDINEVSKRLVDGGYGISPTNSGIAYADANDVIKDSIKIATAMCARVSYTVVGEEDKKPNIDKDIELHDRLAASGHWSPFEHCAKAMSADEANYSPGDDTYEGTAFSGNFRGFIQYRKMFANENKRN